MITLVLGVAIGATTAMFSVFYGVLLQRLPFPDPGRLVVVGGAAAPPHEDAIAYWGHPSVFEKLAMYSSGEAVVEGPGEATPAPTAVVTRDFFSVLGVAPGSGRPFLPAEESAGANNVVIVSEGYRQRHLAGRDPIGQNIVLNGFRHTVVGTMPAGFRYPGQTDLWVPGAAYRRSLNLARTPDAVVGRMIGRLRPGVDLDQARSVLADLHQRLTVAYPRLGFGVRPTVTALQERLYGEYRRPLLTLFAAAACVLLIACTNAANLILARAAARQKEIAIRLCLGAGRMGVAAQLLAESTLLGAVSGLVGLFFAAGFLRAVSLLHAGQVPRLEEISLNAPVLLFGVVTSLIAGTLVGMAPAFQVFGSDPAPVLKGDPGQRRGRFNNRLRRVLVGAEIGLALVLVTAASLAMRHFQALMSVDPGFTASSVLTAQVQAPQSRYPNAARLLALQQNILEHVGMTPGVITAAFVSDLPLAGAGGGYLWVAPPPPRYGAIALQLAVTPAYFQTLRIPLLDGRLFSNRDTAASPPVIVINESLARRLWGRKSPVGDTLRIGGQNATREVIGVVADIKFLGLDDAREQPGQFYLPYGQTAGAAPSNMSLVVLTTVEPANAAQAVRRAAQSADPGLILTRVRTMEAVLSASTAPPRFRAFLFGAFGVVALSFAAFAVYSVTAYSVTCRTREIGVRLSIGARPWHIAVMVLGETAWLAAGGVVAGLILQLAIQRVAAGAVAGLGRPDVIGVAVAALILSGGALAACAVPLRQAIRVDPAAALRHE